MVSLWALKNKCCPVQFWIGLDLHLFLSFAREYSTFIFKRLFPNLFVTMKNIKQQTLSNFLFASSFCRGKKYWEFILKKEFMGVELQIPPMRTCGPRTYTKRVSRNFILIVLHDHVVTGKKSNHISQLLVFFNVYIISY